MNKPYDLLSRFTFFPTLLILICMTGTLKAVTIYENTTIGGWDQMEDYWGDTVKVLSNAVLTVTEYATTGSNYAYTYDHGTLNLKRHAQLVGFTLAKNSSTINIHGGEAGERVFADDQSTLNVFGGIEQRLYGRNNGVVNVYGGSIRDWMLMYDQAALNVWGYNLKMTYDKTNSNGAYYTLSGTLLDGTGINQTIIIAPGYTGNIQLRPPAPKIERVLFKGVAFRIDWSPPYNRFIVDRMPEVSYGSSAAPSICSASSQDNVVKNTVDIPVFPQDRTAFYRLVFGREVVSIRDGQLDSAIRLAIGEKLAPTNRIYDVELENLTNFTASSCGVTDLAGIEAMVSLSALNVQSNLIEDISPILDCVLNGGFAYGGDIYLSGNPLTEYAQTNQIPILTNKWITVHWP
jgi:hypothetical protein